MNTDKCPTSGQPAANFPEHHGGPRIICPECGKLVAPTRTGKVTSHKAAK